MKKVNIIMMWLCVALGVACVGLFIFSWVNLRQIDAVPIVFAVGAALTAKVFWKRYRAADRPKIGEPN